MHENYKIIYDYDYSLLKKRMNDYRYSVRSLAESIGITRVSLSNKLNNHLPFSQDEILKIAKLLDINYDQIAHYFFAIVVNKRLQNVNSKSGVNSLESREKITNCKKRGDFYD
ncbi:DUF739 family protein [Limosilactobacillus mucosae]|uniref:DUF739 family protein n=1 Tax=Limosilactobacillus mucosae TaxID=97478 RepID=UPI00242F049E|nr:DUF739 family protein [Limosilactobacillus mucosae]